MSKTKHKHAAMIKAWADGAKIEKFCQRSKKWVVTDHPTWGEDTEYRIRKAVIFEERYVAFDSPSQQIVCVTSRIPAQNVRFCFTADGELISVVKLEGK
jgi:hypothetical protein